MVAKKVTTETTEEVKESKPKKAAKVVVEVKPKAVAVKKPQTMAELMAKRGQTMTVPKKGDIVKGIVIDKKKKSLVLEIGAKTEGIVADKEFLMAQAYIEKIELGDEIEAQVVSMDNDRGSVLLSLRQAAMEDKWEYFEKAKAAGETIEVRGVEVNKGGLIVFAKGVRGFIPTSQFGKQFLGKLQTLRGENVVVKVIEVDKENNRLIFSERHVSEAGEIEQREAALHSVTSGDVYEGAVSGVMPFGLFVTVEVNLPDAPEGKGQVEGLVHISEISWEKVENPKNYHKVGDLLKVKVLGIDDQTGKLNLSIKQLQDDPWKDLEKNYPVGTTFTGKITRREPFGVFVNAEPGVDGLMHSSKITPGTEYSVGEEVTVSVEQVDSQQHRMSLSPVLTELPVDYK